MAASPAPPHLRLPAHRRRDRPVDGGAGQALPARLASWSPPDSTRTRPTWTPPSPTGWTGCPLAARKLRTLRGLLFWSRRAAVLTREMRRGVHLVRQHEARRLSRRSGPWSVLGTPVRGPAPRRRSPHPPAPGPPVPAQAPHRAGAHLLGRGARGQQPLDPRPLPQPAERAGARGRRRSGAGRAARRRPRVLPAGRRHHARCASAIGLGEGRWLLSVARLSRHKGVDTALKALASLRGQLSRSPLRGGGLGRGAGGAGGGGAPARRGRSGAIPDRSARPRSARALQRRRGLPRRVATDGAAGGGVRDLASRRRPPAASRSSPAGAAASPRPCGTARPGSSWMRSAPTAVAEAVAPSARRSGAPSRLGAAGRRAVETYYNWDRVAGDLARIGREFARRAVPQAVS